MKRSVKYGISGAICGIANGFFGAGGGLLLVPLLSGWIKIPTKKAFATSVFIIVPICAVSAVIYFYGGAFNFRAALPYLVGGTLGGIISGKVFRKISAKWLKLAFGILMLYGGIRAVFLG